jgi:glycosyltransferase involved in cell wall biosynthesis
VLFFLTDLEIGGTPTVVRELAVRLRSASVQTSVACLAPWGPVAGELRAAGVPVVPLGASSVLQLPLVARRFAGMAAKVDVVMSFLMHANVVASIAARRNPRVRFIQSVQTTQAYPAWHWPLQALAARAAERVVVPSASVADVCTQWADVPPAKIRVVPNAIDLAEFVKLQRGRFETTSPRVGFVGRLDPVKRVPDLVNAMAMLPGWQLDVFGEGDDRRAIVDAAAAGGVTDRVHLHGRIARSQQAIGLMDALVLPSDAEGFGLVLIEAMAAGVPVVATDVPGIRDVVRHGETGLLVPPRSPAAIAGALRRLADDPALRRALTAAASRRVEAAYTWPPVLDQYRSLLRGDA